MSGGRGRALAVLLLGPIGCVKRSEVPAPTAAVPSPSAPVEISLPSYPGGERHRLESDRGSVVLLDVWASWCEPCRESLPTYEQLLAKYGSQGLKVYAVNVDQDPKQVASFLAETPVRLPILLDRDAEVAERTLGVKLMPTAFLIDRAGRIRFVHEGWADEFLAKYQAQIEQLLAERAP